jgi:hypothetical protein
VLGNQPGLGACVCNPNYVGGKGSMTVVQGQPQAKAEDTLWENN